MKVDILSGCITYLKERVLALIRDKDIVRKAGFEILRSYEETEEEHHLWILAEKKD